MNKMEDRKMPRLRFKGFENEQEHSSYRKYRFEDIFLFSTGKNIKQSEAAPEFEIPCVRYGELYHMYNEVIVEVFNRTNLNRDELTFSKGDEILLPSAGEDPMDIGSASALPFSGVAIGRTINILRPKLESLYSQIYVSYYINQKLKGKIATLAKGVSISNVYNSDLKQLEITLPTLPEQQKIATFLTAVDTKLQQLTRKLALLEQYKKGVMQQLFSGEVRFRDEQGEAFPGWEEKTLGEIAMKFMNGGTPPTSKAEYWEGDIPWVSGADIVNQKVSEIRRYITLEAAENSSTNIVKKGNLLIVTRTGVGKVAIAPFDIAISQDFTGVYLDDKIMDVFFLYQYLCLDEKKLTEKSQGTSISGITRGDLLALSIPVPTLPEQQKIAAFLSALDGRIAGVKGQLERGRAWKKGLLQGMFV